MRVVGMAAVPRVCGSGLVGMPHIGCPAPPAAQLCVWPIPLGRAWPRSCTTTGARSHTEPLQHSRHARRRPVERPATTAAAASAAAAAAAAPASDQPNLAAAPAAAPHSGSPDGSFVSIWWDLDNVTVQHPAHLPLVGRRLQLAVRQHLVPLGRQQEACQLTAYANERTLASLGGAEAAAAALALVGGRLVAVATRK